MWNSFLVGFFGALLSLALVGISSSFAYLPEEATWQLVVISSEPACSGYHYYMVEKYNEIVIEYLDLYQLFHGSYEPECYTEDNFFKEYEKPFDLDLLILVFDEEKGISELHTHNAGGVYIHHGNDLSTNHNIIICDCPNFKYSDSVWILSHELSHFVLNYLGFVLDEVEEEIHGIDYKFDRCVEEKYTELCSTIKTRIETERSFWTVMMPYAPAIGKPLTTLLEEKISLESTYQKTMIKELTNWWIDGEISNENYIKSLKILSGKVDDGKVIPNGIFKNSAILMLTEPRHDNTAISEDDSNKINENFNEINFSITKNQTVFSKTDHDIFLNLLNTKATSWRENKINDDEFLSEISNIIDSSSPNSFLNYVKNLSFDELILKAKKYHESGDYTNSLSFYQHALSLNSISNEEKIKVLMGKGIVLSSMGEYDNALENYDLALELEPKNSDLLKKKAFVLAQLGFIDEAEYFFKIAKQNELK